MPLTITTEDRIMAEDQMPHQIDPFGDLFEGRDEIATDEEAELHYRHLEARRRAALRTLDQTWKNEAALERAA